MAGNIRFSYIFVFMLVLLGSFGVRINEAQAVCTCDLASPHSETRSVIGEGFADLREFWVGEFWEQVIRDLGLKPMITELNSVADGMVMSLGSQMDVARNQDTLLAKNNFKADVFMETTPLNGDFVCAVGSTLNTVRQGQDFVAATQNIVKKPLMARNTHLPGQSGDEGPIKETNLRMDEICDTYGNSADEIGGIGIHCGGPSAAPQKVNSDIDPGKVFGRSTIDNLMIGDSDFSTKDARALGRNLYRSNITSPISASLLNEMDGIGPFMDARSVSAQYSVAQHIYTNAVKQRMPNQLAAPSPIITYVAEYAPPASISGFGSANWQIYLVRRFGKKPGYLGQLGLMNTIPAVFPGFVESLIDTTGEVNRVQSLVKTLGNWTQYETNESMTRQNLALAGIVESELRRDEIGLQERILNLRKSE